MDTNLSYKKIISWFGCALLTLILVSSVIFGMFYTQMNDEKHNLLQSLQSTQSSLSKTQSELNETIAQKNSLSSEAQQSGLEYNKKIGELNTEITGLNDQINQLKKNSTSSAIPVLGPVNLYNATNSGDKICYLTFDDGPSDNTLKILDILNNGRAKATFFVIGTKQLSYVKNIQAAGHSVGLHTDTHVFHTIYANENAYFADLNSIQAKVNSLLGVNVTLMRFAGGSSNAVSKKYNAGIMTRLIPAVIQKGFQYVDWNIDSGDAAGNNVPAEKIVNNIRQQVPGKKDICILMHDTSAKGTTVQALPHIISYLRGQGYRFEALTKDSEPFHHQHLNN